MHSKRKLSNRREQAIALANTAAQERDRAEAASKAKSEFLANMSHELRTPLNAILGYAQILRRAVTPSQSPTRGLDTIISSGRHLLALINDVLDFSKVEADKLELRPHPVKLTYVVQHVADVIGMKARKKVFFSAPSLPTAFLSGSERTSSTFGRSCSTS